MHDNQLAESEKFLSRIYSVLFVIIAVTIVMAVIGIASTREEITSSGKRTAAKIDTVISSQSTIDSNLTVIDQKIDRSTQQIIDSISDLSRDLIKTNQSILKIGRDVDTLIVYIKK